jgi:hypothetical protein
MEGDGRRENNQLNIGTGMYGYHFTFTFTLTEAQNPHRHHCESHALLLRTFEASQKIPDWAHISHSCTFAFSFSEAGLGPSTGVTCCSREPSQRGRRSRPRRLLHLQPELVAWLSALPRGHHRSAAPKRALYGQPLYWERRERRGWGRGLQWG